MHWLSESLCGRASLSSSRLQRSRIDQKCDSARNRLTTLHELLKYPIYPQAYPRQLGTTAVHRKELGTATRRNDKARRRQRLT